MLRTPKPPEEKSCQYQTRNLWRSSLDRMRVIAAMRPEQFPTVEHVLNVALVEGRVQPPEGVIDAPIARDPRHRKRMAVVAGGREARTRYRLLREVDGRSLVEVRPETGRTHQIRVHFAALGHPLVGDPVYGRRKADAAIQRQFLHATRLAFRHPRTGERLELEAPLADDLTRALAEIEGQSPVVLERS